MDPHRDPVRLHRRGAALWITLARPERLNALDATTLGALRKALDEAQADTSLRVLVLTGQGRAFCAGADLAEVAGPGRAAFLDGLFAAFEAFDRFEKPLIGALNGITVAGGLELALRCDLLIAAEGARIGDAHITHGLVPGGGAATLLPDRIGRARANQLLLTGDILPAATLSAWGLVNWVVPDDDLEAEADRLAVRLAGLDPAALASIKRTLHRDAADALAREHAGMRLRLATHENLGALKRFGARSDGLTIAD